MLLEVCVHLLHAYTTHYNAFKTAALALVNARVGGEGGTPRSRQWERWMNGGSMSIPISARSGARRGREIVLLIPFMAAAGSVGCAYTTSPHCPPLLLFPYPEQTNCFLMKVFLSPPPLPPLPPAEGPPRIGPSPLFWPKGTLLRGPSTQVVYRTVQTLLLTPLACM